MSQRMAGATDETQVKSSPVTSDVTAEVNGLFEDWMRTVEDKILDLFTKEKSMTPLDIAAKIKSQESFNLFMDKMKKEAKLERA